MKWGCSEETGQPKDGSPPLLLSEYFPDEDFWATNCCIFKGLLWSLLLAISASKGVWWGVCISNQAMRNTYIKPLVKHTAVLIHYFWCSHIYNFLVAQQKEHLWFHSPVVLTSQCEQEQALLDVCCVLQGMELYQIGARLFIPPARARQC